MGKQIQNSNSGKQNDIIMWTEKLRKIFWVQDGNWAHDLPWDIYKQLSCSEVNRHLTGTVTFESDFLKPNEHMVPQSREIHRRFYDGGTNLTPPPNSQMSACFGRINFKLGKFPYFKAFFPAALIDIHLLVLIKRGNVYQSWRNPRLTRLWNNERFQRQWTWAPPLAQKCRWKGNLKCRRIKQKSAKVN